MTETTDVAVIGAGPAGLSAAAVAADCGLGVALLDDQPEAGGQIYRAIGRASRTRERILGPDYGAGRAFLAALDKPRLRHLSEATVWNVTPEREIYFSRPAGDGPQSSAAAVLQARHLIVCTGATERPMPFPGWTLPGVMTAGAGQILLKASGVLPAQPTVLAGSGPLLLLLAAQYLRAGQPLAAIVETTPPGNRWQALRHLPGALRGNAVLRKGLSLLAELRRGGVPHVRGAHALRAEGESGQVESLRFTCGDGAREIPCRTLLIHNGVVPNVQISRGLGLSHDWDDLQRCWRPRLGPWGESELDGIAIAGDGGGIAGAEAAAERGRIAGLQAAWRLGALSEDEAARRAAAPRRRLARQEAVRPFLDALYAPARELLDPPDETVVCRCEEVTAASIRGYVKLGCLGPNQVKSFGRPGMGPCQGRFCGLSVAEIIAAARGVSPDEVGYYRIRPPFKPVTLGEIASIELPEDGGAESRSPEHLEDEPTAAA